MAEDASLSEALEALAEDDEEARAVSERLERELEERHGFGLDRVAELDEMLREYADDLRSVHEDHRRRLEEAGFEEFVPAGEPDRAVPSLHPDRAGGPADPGGGTGDLGPLPGDGFDLGVGDPVRRLRDLKALLDEEVIEESEFEECKRHLLDRL